MKNDTDIVQHQPTAAPLVRAQDVPFSVLLQGAIDKGMPPESLEKMLDLYERVQANAAKSAFQAAMAKFKEICPPIPRKTENPQFSVMRNGIKVPRKYAATEDIETTIREPLGGCGLSFRWGDSKIDQGMVTLPCIVSHVGGHSESSSVTMPLESNAGCSSQQKYGISYAYLQRYSLIQALGLTTCDEDADGNDPSPPIVEAQIANLEMLIGETKADRAKFLLAFKIAKVEEMKVSDYPRAVAMLNAKKEHAAKKAVAS